MYVAIHKSYLWKLLLSEIKLQVHSYLQIQPTSCMTVSTIYIIKHVSCPYNNYNTGITCWKRAYYSYWHYAWCFAMSTTSKVMLSWLAQPYNNVILIQMVNSYKYCTIWITKRYCKQNGFLYIRWWAFAITLNRLTIQLIMTNALGYDAMLLQLTQIMLKTCI